MAYPKGYEWLADVVPLPRTIQEALKLLGVHETPGSANNPVIMAWAKEIGGNVATAYAADAVPWCGLFAAIVVKRAGKDVIAGPLWAKGWLNFGIPVEQPGLGDVLVFGRTGGGHVCFYLGEDASAYHVIGGNQADMVCTARMPKTRFLGARRPHYNVQPASVKPYHIAANGKLSVNEA